MAINVNTLAGYIKNEIGTEFSLGSSNEALDKYAQAMSRAISKYLSDNVEVAVGQQITGQGVGEVDIGGTPTTINTEVTGKVTTKGNLI